MADIRKVKPGDEIEIHAKTWNSFIDAANYTKQQGQIGASASQAAQKNASIVKVINTSGDAIDRWHAVAVTGVHCEPVSSDLTDPKSLQFQNQLVLEVDVPSADDAGMWLVLLQPLEDQGIGLAVGIGVTQAWVNINDAADLKVDVTDDGADVPVSGDVGNDILWVAGGAGSATATGEQLAVIRIGGTMRAMFPVKVTKTGGSAGDETTACSFVYTAKNMDGKTLGTGLTPQKKRTSAGAYVAPADDTIGVGYFDGADFKLWDANEVPDVEGCG